ncbi:hypothetical protein D3C77_457070 [compost metagenome]
MIKEAAEFAVTASLGQVNHDLRLLVNWRCVTHSLNPLLQQLSQVIEITSRTVRQEHPAINFIADLHHIRISIYCFQLRQYFICVIINRLLQFRETIPFPRSWFHLLTWISPKIRIMEIHEQFHPSSLNTLSHRDRMRLVIVSIRLHGIIPNS